MYSDARELENGSKIFGDLCVIGSGPAGLSIALDWNGRKEKVILLEGGGFDYDIQQQRLFSSKSIGQDYYSIEASRIHAFGGTTFLWGGFCSPLDEIDFEERSWVPNSGWPISLNDLRPYFEKVADIFDLESDNFDPSYYLNIHEGKEPLFAENFNVNDKIWQFSPPTRLGTKYKDTLLKSSNIELITYSRVTEIHVGESTNSIEKVVVRNLAGKEHEIFAKNFVLAAGAIQNARLILASDVKLRSLMGDSFENVGKYFMEHIEINSGELWLKGDHQYSFYKRKWKETKNRAEICITKEAQRNFEILNGTVSMNPLTEGKTHENFEEHLNKRDASGNPRNRRGIFEKIENRINKMGLFKSESYKNAFNLYVRMEQAPSVDSYLKLDTEKDELGLEKIVLNWRLGDLEKHSILKVMEIIGTQAGIEDIGRMKLEDYLTDLVSSSDMSKMIPGCHHMGTTRMSKNPERGVVDKNCLVFGLSNLYMAGASCFPTAGAANPTFSLSALSLRLSDHLKNI
jgi:choline dehydrogenase-like flavoprotein